MCYTSNVVKRGREGGAADLAQMYALNLDSRSPSLRRQMEESTAQLSDQILHLPHTALAPTKFTILVNCRRPLSLLFFIPLFGEEDKVLF